MKEFVLIFRLKDISDFRPTPEQMQERMNWLAGISSQSKLLDKGNTLLPFAGSAKTIKSNKEVTDGVYTENKEFVSGYVGLRSIAMDEAVEIAKANPIDDLVGGNMASREVFNRDWHLTNQQCKPRKNTGLLLCIFVPKK